MPKTPIPALTIGLLIASNIFMTFAWYGHLCFKKGTADHGDPDLAGDRPVRIDPSGAGEPLWPWHLQCGATQSHPRGDYLLTFAVFSTFYLKEPLGWNHALGFSFIALGA